MQVLDGRPAQLAEAAVHVGDAHLDLVALGLVILALEPRRHEHLEHRDGLGSRRVLFEDSLEGVELLRDALRVVEAFDPEHELLALVTLRQLRLDARRLRAMERLAKASDVDADRFDAEPDRAAVVRERIRFGLESEHPQAGRAEVSGVVPGVEPDVVGPEQARARARPEWAGHGRSPTTGTGCAGSTRLRDRVVCAGVQPARERGGSRGSRHGLEAH